jgi:hypothetical protein
MLEIKLSMRCTTDGRSKKTTSNTGENRSAKELCPGADVASAGTAGTPRLHPDPFVSPAAVGTLQLSGLSELTTAGFEDAIGFRRRAILNCLN